MNWENARHFAAFAEKGSLLGAARALGVEHATIARRISALEAELQLKLVDRRGNRLRLTAEGQSIANMVETMSQNAEALEKAAAGARVTLIGHITISAPPALAAACLIAPLAELRARHPHLTIHLRPESRNPHPDHGEADIIIRLLRPSSDTLISTKLGVMPFRPYAHRDYLATTSPADWTFIGHDNSVHTSAQGDALHEVGRSQRVMFTANTIELQRAAATAGMGIAILPRCVVSPNDGLVTVDQIPPVEREIWLSVHPDLQDTPNVKATLELLNAVKFG